MEDDLWNNLDEIEDLVGWNLSFNISIKQTLTDINKLEYLELFENNNNKKNLENSGAL